MVFSSRNTANVRCSVVVRLSEGPLQVPLYMCPSLVRQVTQVLCNDKIISLSDPSLDIKLQDRNDSTKIHCLANFLTIKIDSKCKKYVQYY